MTDAIPAPIGQHRAEGILTLSFERPARKNALTLAMYDTLTAALTEAAADDTLRAVILTGSGGIFTSGNDLQDFMLRPPQNTDTPVFCFLQALATFTKPLLAAVDGPAVGIGTTLLLHCDLAWASPASFFQMPFTQLALVPEAGSSYLLPRSLGHRRAAELLLLGERFGPETAREAGLINAVIPADELLAHATAKARALAALPPAAVQASKRLMKAPFAATLDQVMRAEGEVFMERLRSAEFAQAMGAFFKKRKP